MSPVFSAKGYIMISGALFADAVIGNLQEKNMKKYGGSSNEMVRSSKGGGVEMRQELAEIGLYLCEYSTYKDEKGAIGSGSEF